MRWLFLSKSALFTAAVMTALALCAPEAPAGAVINGLEGTTFALTASSGHISAADGISLHVWGYTETGGPRQVQYPGPTLIVSEGATVSITLTNDLDQPTSIVFPGQEGVTTDPGDPGVPGLLTQEAEANGGTVTYQFAASRPGTYHYHSGTRPDLQVEMGLVGALIVRPAGFDPENPTAYGGPDSAYDHEYLFLFTEMDYQIHLLVEFGS